MQQGYLVAPREKALVQFYCYLLEEKRLMPILISYPYLRVNNDRPYLMTANACHSVTNRDAKLYYEC